MTKLNDIVFKNLYDKVCLIDKKTEENRIKRKDMIRDAGITLEAYNYRVRTKKF